MKIKNKLFRRLFKKQYYYLGRKKYDLIIYDDIYPNPISGFRYEEFSQLLNTFKNSKIITNPLAYMFVGGSKKEHSRDIDKCIKERPYLKGKIFKKRKFSNINTKLFYCVFLHNIYKNLKYLEKYNIPFMFTLYPGGGFYVNSLETDKKLKELFSSKNFRGVFVTQPFTKDYILNKKLCSKEHIKLIYGCVIPQYSFLKEDVKKTYYPKSKAHIDICFSAIKYTPRGLDKGYDLVVELAHKLLKKYSFIKFHIIGGFQQKDINIEKIKQNINFYGYQEYKDMSKLYENFDIILSPNRPFVRNENEFDGFPLGTVIEAALKEVAVVLTDELNQNLYFKEGEELIIIKPNIHSLEKEIVALIENPKSIYSIAKKGKLKFQKLYSNDIQLKERIGFIKEKIK
tara:strand:+ start:616 stop:1812 length:1197 start_codon:yes stop_codon:yes gene_type:complete